MASLRQYVSLRTRNFLTLLPFIPNTKPTLPFRSLAVPTCSRPSFYSSGFDSPNQNNLMPNDSNRADDVSTAELKILIERYAKGGDDNVIPHIFEAVLERTLSGNHEESDDELLEELERNRPPEQELQSEDNCDDDELPEVFGEILERTFARHLSTMPSQSMDSIKEGESDNLESGDESDSEDENVHFLPSGYEDSDEQLETSSEDSDEQLETSSEDDNTDEELETYSEYLDETDKEAW